MRDRFSETTIPRNNHQQMSSPKYEELKKGEMPNFVHFLNSKGVTPALCAQMLKYFKAEYELIDWTQEEDEEIVNSKLSHRRLLRTGWQRQYASDYYGNMIARSVKYLFPNKVKGRRVLEVGCGTGTQTIFYSILGAEATGIDVNRTRISIAEKRLKLYLNLISDRPLKIRLICDDVFNFEPSESEHFDAIYSMFSLNLIQPTADILLHLRKLLTPNGRLVVDDGNYGYLPMRITRKKSEVLLPKEMVLALRQAGFRVLEIRHGAVVPPWCWIVPSFARFMSSWENRLQSSPYMARAYWFVAERK
jgi:SAM-dependent methyltransferase